MADQKSKSTLKREAVQKDEKLDKAWQKEPVGEVEKDWKNSNQVEVGVVENPEPKKADMQTRAALNRDELAKGDGPEKEEDVEGRGINLEPLGYGGKAGRKEVMETPSLNETEKQAARREAKEVDK